MKIPVIRGIIERRILVNFRVDPDALKRVLPEPFRPKLISGAGMAGICLIRLKHIRPRFLPAFVGITSENAAHRIAVQWEFDGRAKEGVYVLRRDTSSRLNAAAGGRLFPGVHHHARFDVLEQDDRYSVIMDSDDGETHLVVEGQSATELPDTSIFPSPDAASEFFKRGSLGYSPASKPGTFDGIELRSMTWRVKPLKIARVESSFFENHDIFPPGSAEFDCALLMRDIAHDWLARESVCSECDEAHQAQVIRGTLSRSANSSCHPD